MIAADISEANVRVVAKDILNRLKKIPDDQVIAPPSVVHGDEHEETQWFRMIVTAATKLNFLRMINPEEFNKIDRTNPDIDAALDAAYEHSDARNTKFFNSPEFRKIIAEQTSLCDVIQQLDYAMRGLEIYFEDSFTEKQLMEEFKKAAMMMIMETINAKLEGFQPNLDGDSDDKTIH